MLHEFLIKNKKEILLLCDTKTLDLAGLRHDSEQLKLGLPLFYDQLIAVLEQQYSSNPPKELLIAAAQHGKEFLRLGYTLSHVVHAYGAMCQAITEYAAMKNANISPSEFNILNGCLDVAIASAVSEFQFRSIEAIEAKEVQHLGSLAHELRNALSSATVAQEMIKAGFVGTGGSTAAVLEANLSQMRHLIDRALSEVRMRADVDLIVEKFRLSDLVDQIFATAKIDANKRKITLRSDVDWKIELAADRQYILSSFGNLIQNAIKYTKSSGQVVLKARTESDRVVVTIQDECGGIDEDKIKTLFRPFTQENDDKSGMGLGLTITQRAIRLSQGHISIRNNPGVGCTFIVDLPLILIPSPSTKTTVPGVDSIQPVYPNKHK